MSRKVRLMATALRRSGVLLLALAMFAGLGGCWKKSTSAHGKKMLVLGCDGMDPKLVRRMMDAGRLPNFSKLAAQGGLLPLTTSIPPQSPVAWSNFITGAGPGVHGIFDFIHRDPTKQALPYYSTNRITAGKKSKPWSLGKNYEIPAEVITPWVSTEENELLRRGKPFWDFLDAAGIPVQMYKLPANYPPSKSMNDHVCCLAGMGVPDAMGQLGTYQQFSTKPRQESRSPEGYRLPLRWNGALSAFVGTLYGPTNEFRRKNPPMTIELRIYPDPANDVAKIVYVNQSPTGDETVELVLSGGQWSEWSPIRFLKTPVGPSFETMARFSFQHIHPEVELYVTPLNFVPTASPVVFSEPPNFQKEIGEAIGPYHTQGFAEAFNARKHQLLTDEEYRAQAATVLDESSRMLDYALDRFQDGLLFFYFSSTDLQAHIFWWDSDEKHPCRSSADAKKYMGVIEDIYVKMDDALGRGMKKLGPDATVIVMSDHGFCNFKKCVGLCTWLRDEGYLVAKSNAILNSDWSKTKAYGLGLNGLYLNLKGREKYGIVDPSERDALLKEISAKLLALKDPETGKPVVRRVYRSDECYQGPEAKNAPDLLIGYDRDYRASWATCLGEFDKSVITDNTSAWSADHCIAHDVVPGIVLSNRPLAIQDPALIDLAPTILSEFGLSKPETMVGRNIFEKTGDRVAGR